jgi:hypothetical protein
MSTHTVPLTSGNEVRLEIPRVLDRSRLAELAVTLSTLVDVADEVNIRPPAVHQFTAAHLRVVFLLAESQGSTHTRLRRAWDAKSARSGPLAWPWISDSGIRTRTSELKAWGLVEWSGAYGETPAGRPSQIWQLTGTDPASVGRVAEPVPGFDRVPVREALAALRDEAGTDLTIRTQLELAAQVAGVIA